MSMKPFFFFATHVIGQSATKSAQNSAKAKVDAIFEDIKAAPKNLQKDIARAGEEAVGQVGDTVDVAESGFNLYNPLGHYYPCEDCTHSRLADKRT